MMKARKLLYGILILAFTGLVAAGAHATPDNSNSCEEAWYRTMGDWTGLHTVKESDDIEDWFYWETTSSGKFKFEFNNSSNHPINVTIYNGASCDDKTVAYLLDGHSAYYTVPANTYNHRRFACVSAGYIYARIVPFGATDDLAYNHVGYFYPNPARPASSPSATPDPPTSGQDYSIGWDVVSGTDYYELQEHGTVGWQTVYSGPNTSFIRNNPQGTYFYHVRACNDDCGCGPWSQESIVTVKGGDGDVPPSDENEWIQAEAFNSHDNLFSLQEIGDGLILKLWSRIDVGDCNSACEYSNNAGVNFVAVAANASGPCKYSDFSFDVQASVAQWVMGAFENMVQTGGIEETQVWSWDRYQWIPEPADMSARAKAFRVAPQSFQCHSDPAQWIEWTTNGTSFNWFIRQPGIYAAEAATITLASDDDVAIDYSGFGNLIDEMGFGDTIPVWYAVAVQEGGGAAYFIEISEIEVPSFAINKRDEFKISYELTASSDLPGGNATVAIYLEDDDHWKIEIYRGDNFAWICCGLEDTYEHEITLTPADAYHLDEGTEYDVIVEVTHPSDTGTGTAEKRVVYRAEGDYFVHVTDLHVESGDNEERTTWYQLLDSIENKQGLFEQSPVFVAVTGDLVDWGHQGTDNYAALLDQGHLYSENQFHYLDNTKKVPIYFSPGNHDAYSWLWLGPRCFHRCGYDFTTYIDNVGPLYRTFTEDHPELAIISMNSGRDICCQLIELPESNGLFGPYVESFKNNLDELDGADNDDDESDYTKVVLMHHPHVDLVEDDWDAGGVFTNNIDAFLNACRDYDVDIVLCGHVHDHPHRDKPYDWNGEDWPGNSTRFVVTGALKDGWFRRIYFAPSGGISRVQGNKPLQTAIRGVLACLAELHIYDNKGNHNGPDENGNIVNEIPGSYYSHEAFEDSLGIERSLTEFYLAKADTIDYVFEIKCLNDSPLNIKILSSIAGSQWTGANYVDIPVVEGSIARFSASESSPDYAITVENPDGTDTVIMVSEWAGNLPPLTPTLGAEPDTVEMDSVSVLKVSTTDPENEQLYYRFDWGNGTSSDWIGPFSSGDTCVTTNAWGEVGTFAVKVSAKDTWNNRSYWSEEVFVCVLANVGDLSGYVTGPEGGLTGVPVDLADSNGQLFAALVTNDLGFYQISDVPNGLYTVSISTPLGYQADEETKQVAIKGLSYEVNFELIKLEITPTQRSMGYWKHQVNVHLSGKGNAQESLADMSNYMSLVGEHFNSNLANPITIFEVPQPATQTDSLEAVQDLLTVNVDGTMNDRAKQQLIALMLNVVSLKLHQTTPISEDNATVSQAITYCHQLITDLDSTNDETAKDIADQINNGIFVAAGVIPLTTPEIAYKGPEDQVAQSSNLPDEFSLKQNYPNPFNPACEIQYALPTDCHVTLSIYNILGQKVRVLVDEYQRAGNKSVTWDGKDDQGREVTSGVYFYRIQAGDFAQSKKMVLMK